MQASLAVRMIVILLVVCALAACGNNRMRGEWDDTRDAINKPFK